MSVNAVVSIRRLDEPSLTAEEIASTLGLPGGPAARTWHETVGPDGSRLTLWLTAEPGDVSGPAVGVTHDNGYAERLYDCQLHVGVADLAGEDEVTALRSYCRFATARLHAALGGLETASYIDADGNYSYRIDPPGLSEAVVDLRLGSEAPLTAPGFSLVEAANRAASGTGLVFTEDEPNRHLAPSEDAGDSVAYTVSSRAEELPFAAGARSGAAAVDARQLDGFTERLLAELARHTAGADLACWVNDRLYRYEVELTPLG
ncbi:hypothetical protein ACFY4B_11390 [Kitasatospora sp. NPDC001261]|uniref:hypothetical protein n=1 Tax=Kitasatospora sp. NPDC001261 TaxID=3364012 RepID=UPI0036C2A084